MTKWIRFYIQLILSVVLILVLKWNFEGRPPLSKIFLFHNSFLVAGLQETESESFGSTDYGDVEIGYDSLGIPAIYAENEFSAAFGVGYCHGRDRLFQIEMLMRTVKGELCEIVGPKALAVDKFWTKFNFKTKAIDWYAKLEKIDPDEYKRTEAYAEGLNTYIDNLTHDELPFEFHLLGFEPSTFEPWQIYLLLRYMSWNLNYSTQDLAYTNTKQGMNPVVFKQYYPNTNPYALPILAELENTDSLLQEIFNTSKKTDKKPASQKEEVAIAPDFYPADRAPKGSNNWVVSGSKTRSTHPILCNDTHLGLKLPSTWYEVHIQVGKEYNHGLSIPGSPYVISGYNNSVAWGMTNATWDLTDFYPVERGADGNFTIAGKALKVDSVLVTIKIKGEDDFEYMAYSTPHGVLDSIEKSMYLVNWVGLQESHEGIAFGKMLKAKSIDDQFKALQYFTQPPQNFVLADVAGNIGLATCGAAAIHPRITHGVSTPIDADDYPKYLPMNDILKVVNPEKGYLSSANQDQVKGNLAAFLSYSFTGSSRAKRIDEVLRNGKHIDQTFMANLQMDHLDIEWEILKPKLLKYVNKEAHTYLANWDGVCDSASIAATLYVTMRYALLENLAQMAFKNTPSFLPNSELVINYIAQYDTLPGEKGPVLVSKLMTAAWETTQTKLTANFGEKMYDWQYKQIHKTSIQHITSLEPLSAAPFPSFGDANTVNVAGGLTVTHGPSMRTIIELKPNGNEAWMMITGGQSGRFESENYQDQIADFRKGTYHKVKIFEAFDASNYVKTISFK